MSSDTRDSGNKPWKVLGDVWNYSAHALRSLMLGWDGSDYQVISVDETGAINVTQTAVVDTPEYFEDLAFTAGDSPAILDFNTALGRNATSGEIINDGAGEFFVSFSTDGAVFGDDIRVKRDICRAPAGALQISW